MDKQTLAQQLQELKTKQEVIDKTWRKAGNRPLLHFFVEIMPKVLDVERCSIFISDPGGDNVWVQCGTGVKERQISVPASNSLVGRVIATGQPQMETNMTDQIGAHDTVAMKTGFVTHDSLVVPVHGVTIDKITGAIQVLNKRGGRPYTEEDHQILNRLALHIQLNIENIYLRQEMGKVSALMSKQIQLLEQKLRGLGR